MRGIDVSHHNGRIDWGKVASSGKGFAILKAMYESSHRPDECFEYNYREASGAGMLLGAYIFIGSRSIQDPKEDAEAFLRILNGRKLEYGVWIDAEASRLRALPKNVIESIILTEADVLEKAGYSVGVYTNIDWHRNVLTDTVKDNYRLWMARYPRNDDGTMHEGISPANIRNVVAWQYSSKGKVPGISGNVDLNIDFGNMAANMRKSRHDIAREVIGGKWGTSSSSPTRRELLTAAGYDYDDIPC